MKKHLQKLLLSFLILTHESFSIPFTDEDMEEKLKTVLIMAENSEQLKNSQKWLTGFKKACVIAKEGDVDAQSHIGFNFMTGNLIERNHDLAFYWLNKAINNGSTSSCMFLFQMFEEKYGECTEKENVFKAIKKEANRGNRYACFILYQYYLKTFNEASYQHAFKYGQKFSPADVPLFFKKVNEEIENMTKKIS